MFRSRKSDRRVANHRPSEEPKRLPYRHIEVTDTINRRDKTRVVRVEVPLEYPGLTERERRKMYEGLSMVADAFRTADARIANRPSNRPTDEPF